MHRSLPAASLSLSAASASPEPAHECLNRQCLKCAPPWPAPCPPCSMQAALGLVQDPSSQGEAVRNACILLAMLVLGRLAIYWTLRRKTRST